VNSLYAFRSSIAAVLLLSVGWKAAIPLENASNLEGQLVDFFQRNKFDVIVNDETAMRIIRATTDGCHLKVARLTSDGWNRDLVERVTAGADHSFIVLRGKVYNEQHPPSMVLEDLRSRLLRRLGLASHTAPIIAVAANESCNAEQLPWAELEATP
jgi:hypothetical protein